MPSRPLEIEITPRLLRQGTADVARGLMLVITVLLLLYWSIAFLPAAWSAGRDLTLVLGAVLGVPILVLQVYGWQRAQVWARQLQQANGGPWLEIAIDEKGLIWRRSDKAAWIPWKEVERVEPCRYGWICWLTPAMTAALELPAAVNRLFMPGKQKVGRLLYRYLAGDTERLPLQKKALRVLPVHRLTLRRMLLVQVIGLAVLAGILLMVRGVYSAVGMSVVLLGGQGAFVAFLARGLTLPLWFTLLMFAGAVLSRLFPATFRIPRHSTYDDWNAAFLAAGGYFVCVSSVALRTTGLPLDVLNLTIVLAALAGVVFSQMVMRLIRPTNGSPKEEAKKPLARWTANCDAKNAFNNR